MREIRTSGLMSGEGKRIAHAAPRLSSTLLVKPGRQWLRIPEYALGIRTVGFVPDKPQD